MIKWLFCTVLLLDLIAPPAVRAAFDLPRPAPSVDTDQTPAPEEGVIFLPIVMRPLPVNDAGHQLRLLFDEPEWVTVFADATGHGNDALCSGFGCPTAGWYGAAGRAISFDGVDDILTVPAPSSLDIGAAEDVTIEAWILPKSVQCGYCRLVAKFDGSRGYSVDMADNQGHTYLGLYLNDGARSAHIRAALNITLNSWHHVAAVLDRGGNHVYLYVDGSEVPYQQPADIAALGSLANESPLTVGGLLGEAKGYQGLIGEAGIYKKALTADEVRNHYVAFTPKTTPWFARWNTDQALRVLRGHTLEVDSLKHFSEADWGVLPVLASEAVEFGIPNDCTTCKVHLYNFADSHAQDQLHMALAAQGAASADAAASDQMFAYDNMILHILGPVSRETLKTYTTTLEAGMLRTVLDAPTNTEESDFEVWNAYYPTDRGQERDPVSGRGQRTFDLWEGNNRWLFGQATWRYQDPDGTDAPPYALPATYAGKPLDYYYHYHCEQERAAEPSQDCLNWQIYIEVLTKGDGDRELANWARGGWHSLRSGPVRWEAYYKPASIQGGCTTAAVSANLDDTFLADPAHKAPLLFRLPSSVGAWSDSPEVCALKFNTYHYRTADVQEANLWRTSTRLLARSYDAERDRFLLKAQNSYYEYLAAVDGDVVYRRWAHEIYWTTEMKASAPLEDGLSAFWWGDWDKPPEDHRDIDGNRAWRPLQWCRLDLTQGPEGLGVLRCEA